MCIRDSYYVDSIESTTKTAENFAKQTQSALDEIEDAWDEATAAIAAVSYTHLDVYKRQQSFCKQVRAWKLPAGCCRVFEPLQNNLRKWSVISDDTIKYQRH